MDFWRRLEEVKRETSLDGWDDEGAKAIPASLWDGKIGALVARMPGWLPSPHPSAAGDGTLCLRWSRPGVLVDLEVGAEGPYRLTRLLGKETEERTFLSLGDVVDYVEGSFS